MAAFTLIGHTETDTSTTLVVEYSDYVVDPSASYYAFYSISASINKQSAYFRPDTLQNSTVTLEGLTPNTGYTVSWSLYERTGQTTQMVDSGTISITTKKTGYDTPKVATLEQWEDLANKVKTNTSLWTEVFHTATSTEHESHSVTTPLGRTISYQIINGGTGCEITQGAEGISAIKIICSRAYDSGVSGTLGVEGVKTGSTVWSRLYTYRSGNWSGGTEYTETVGSDITYATMVPCTSSGKTAMQYEATIIQGKTGTTDRKWRIFGKVGWTGVGDTASFDVEVTSTDLTTSPSPYQRGNSSVITNTDGFIYVQFLEKPL